MTSTATRRRPPTKLLRPARQQLGSAPIEGAHLWPIHSAPRDAKNRPFGGLHSLPSSRSRQSSSPQDVLRKSREPSFESKLGGVGPVVAGALDRPRRLILTAAAASNSVARICNRNCYTVIETVTHASNRTLCMHAGHSQRSPGRCPVSSMTGGGGVRLPCGSPWRRAIFGAAEGARPPEDSNAARSLAWDPHIHPSRAPQVAFFALSFECGAQSGRVPRVRLDAHMGVCGSSGAGVGVRDAAASHVCWCCELHLYRVGLRRACTLSAC